MQKILITGTAGFIGFHLVDRLVNEDFQIIGLDNINNYYDVSLKHARLREHGIEAAHLKNKELTKSNTLSNYSFVKADLEDRDFLLELFEEYQFDFVVALAAQAGVRYSLEAPEKYIKSNIEGFFNILESCRAFPVTHLIYASTSSVYGLNEKMPFKESDSANHPISLYSATKKSNEVMAHSYSHLFQIPTTGLRFFTVYGPWGRPDMALFKFAKAMLKGEAIDAYNHGNMVRDFTYVTDITENIARLLTIAPHATDNWDALQPNPAFSSAPYRILNIGNNNPVALKRYIEAIEEALNMEAEKNLLPMQPGDVPATYADVDALTMLTGFKPQTDVKTGVEQFVKWYKEYYAS